MRSIKMLGLTLVAMSAFFAVMASSASAKEPVIYVGLPAVELAGTLLISVVQKTTSESENFMEATLSGTKVKITCEEISGDGTVENPAGGGPAVATHGALTYKKCKVVEPHTTGCEIKSPGEPNGTLKLDPGVTGKAAWAESSGERTVGVTTGEGAKEEYEVIQFTTACKLPLGVTEVNLKGQLAANLKPAAVMSQMPEAEFPATKITEYFTGSAPGTKHTLKTLEVEAIGGLAKAPAVLVNTYFALQAPGILPWLGLLAAGGMGTR